MSGCTCDFGNESVLGGDFLDAKYGIDWCDTTHLSSSRCEEGCLPFTCETDSNNDYTYKCSSSTGETYATYNDDTLNSVQKKKAHKNWGTDPKTYACVQGCSGHCRPLNTGVLKGLGCLHKNTTTRGCYQRAGLTVTEQNCLNNCTGSTQFTNCPKNFALAELYCDITEDVMDIVEKKNCKQKCLQ